MSEGRELLGTDGGDGGVECAKDQYPQCIVWSPIPMLTWMLPVSGHLGITDSTGLVSDFAGSGYIHNHRRRTAFGPITKYVAVRPGDLHAVQPGEIAAAAWNRAIAAANTLYCSRNHNLLTENCHHHVAAALNELRYRNRTDWGTVSLHLLMMRHGRFVSTGRFVGTYVGFAVLLALVALVVVLVRVV